MTTATKRMTPKQRQVLELFADGRERTSAEAFNELGGGKSKAGLTSVLRDLRSAGLLSGEAIAPGVPYTDWRYRLTAAGADRLRGAS